MSQLYNINNFREMQVPDGESEPDHSFYTIQKHHALFLLSDGCPDPGSRLTLFRPVSGPTRAAQPVFTEFFPASKNLNAIFTPKYAIMF